MPKREVPELERLHVRIAHSGLCSRRAAEKLIQEARVEVNNEVVVELGRKVGPDDVVKVDGITIKEAKLYTLLFHKPAGVVTTLFDPQNRPTIKRYLPDYGVQLKPVGRLDKDTDGLLIVTNDGELALRVTHPRYGLEKDIDKLRKGIFIEGGKTQPAHVEFGFVDDRKETTSFRMTIKEGRKRQVRLMCEAIGHDVVKLTRIRIGPFLLKGLSPGECRLMGKQDLDKLRKMIGLDV